MTRFPCSRTLPHRNCAANREGRRSACSRVPTYPVPVVLTEKAGKFSISRMQKQMLAFMLAFFDFLAILLAFVFHFLGQNVARFFFFHFPALFRLFPRVLQPAFFSGAPLVASLLAWQLS